MGWPVHMGLVHPLPAWTRGFLLPSPPSVPFSLWLCFCPFSNSHGASPDSGPPLPISTTRTLSAAVVCSASRGPKGVCELPHAWTVSCLQDQGFRYLRSVPRWRCPGRSLQTMRGGACWVDAPTSLLDVEMGGAFYPVSQRDLGGIVPQGPPAVTAPQHTLSWPFSLLLP